MERPMCCTCPHWQDMGEPSDTCPTEFNMGRCEAHPPVATYAIQERTGKLLLRWDRPETEGWQGCGEHPEFPAYLATLKADSAPPE